MSGQCPEETNLPAPPQELLRTPGNVLSLRPAESGEYLGEKTNLSATFFGQDRSKKPGIIEDIPKCPQ